MSATLCELPCRSSRRTGTKHQGSLAPKLERWFVKPMVLGASPRWPSNASRSRLGRPRTCNAVRRFDSDGKLHARRVHWGERHCDKVDLQGSIPWLRTTWRIPPAARRAGSQLDNEGSIPSFATMGQRGFDPRPRRPRQSVSRSWRSVFPVSY